MWLDLLNEEVSFNPGCALLVYSSMIFEGQDAVTRRARDWKIVVQT